MIRFIHDINGNLSMSEPRSLELARLHRHMRILEDAHAIADQPRRTAALRARAVARSEAA